ncbi:MAG TPA: hypothetical protein VK272_07590 [Solirubrobacteraceae bacterium]|nr:hypothetical protein [Solirubrobacteraceae bacterium]
MILLTSVVSACLSGVALGSPSQTFTLGASFTPNELGAPTNLSTNMTFASSAGVPQPVSDVVAYGPAGLAVDVHGIPTCERAKLEADGPSGCPAQSRVGFGGGVGVVELAGALVKEPYTLDFFLAPREHGHLAMLIYVSAANPVPVQLVLAAKGIHGPRPYGFGLAVEVPAVNTLPGAALASVETSYASLGGANIAYYRTIHGKRKLVHVKGLIEPATCPSGGFPFEALVTFAEGSTSTGSYSSPCPRARR